MTRNDKKCDIRCKTFSTSFACVVPTTWCRTVPYCFVLRVVLRAVQLPSSCMPCRIVYCLGLVCDCVVVCSVLLCFVMLCCFVLCCSVLFYFLCVFCFISFHLCVVSCRICIVLVCIGLDVVQFSYVMLFFVFSFLWPRISFCFVLMMNRKEKGMHQFDLTPEQKRRIRVDTTETCKHVGALKKNHT